MPKKRVFLLASVIAAASLVLLSYQNLNHSVSEAPLSADAFMKARWGMSPDEVMAANQITLFPPHTNKRFFSPKEMEGDRHKTLQSSGQLFLGREAEVYYTFKDNRLCMYHVFVSDSDEELLDKDMRNYLNRKWGETAGTPQEDESTLKLLWQFKDVIVNYWLYQDEMALKSHFKAGVGVTYRPIIEG